MSSLFHNLKLSSFTFISRIISGSIIYIALARLMSISEFGLLSFGATLAGLATVFAEYGYSLMALRDIPQNQFPFKPYVYNSFLQKTAFSILSLIIGLTYLFVFYSNINLQIGVIFILTAVVTSNTMYLLSIFRAKNLFETESVSALIYSTLLIFLVLLYYFFELEVVHIAYAILSARISQLLYLIFKFQQKFNFNKLKVDKQIQSYLFQNSFSFGFHYLIGIFYLTIDNQIIAYYIGNNAVALYQSIFKIIFILLSLADLINNVFLPYMSSIYKVDIKKFKQFVLTSNSILVTIGLLLFVFFNFFAFHIVTLLYTEKYIPALSVSIPLSIILFLRIVSSVYGIILTISNHQKIRVIIVLISLVLNVVLNLIYIPKYSYVGAAYVSLITHLVLFSLYSLYSYKLLGSFFINKKLFSLLILSFGLLCFFEILNIKTSFVISSAFMVFWTLLVMLTFSKEDFLKIKNTLSRKF